MRVLITGTSSGIGKAIAEKFLKEGFDVTGFDRKEASISQDSYTHFCQEGGFDQPGFVYSFLP